MTKLIDCPECGKIDQPVRDDALVCSSGCRVKKFRRLKKEVKQMRDTTDKTKKDNYKKVNTM